MNVSAGNQAGIPSPTASSGGDREHQEADQGPHCGEAFGVQAGDGAHRSGLAGTEPGPHANAARDAVGPLARNAQEQGLVCRRHTEESWFECLTKNKSTISSKGST